MTSQNNPFFKKASGQPYQPQQEQQQKKQNPFFAKASQPSSLNQQQSIPEYIARTAGAAGTGYASGTPYGLTTNLMNFLAMGDVYDPEEIERIRAIAEREGVPFDEEKYLEAGKQALGSFPTPQNIARMAEEATGLPITPKDKFQKSIEMATTAGRAQPGALSQKVVSGAVAPSVSAGAQELGVPEVFAEPLGYGVAGAAGHLTPAIEFGKATHPSGLPKRQFENVKQPREVSAKKHEKISSKLENDFRDIGNNIIIESPISKTAEIIKENPAYKQEVSQQFDKVYELAQEMPGKSQTADIKKIIVDNAKKNREKGYVESEYEADYQKHLNETIRKMKDREVSTADLVDQYRKNNESLSEAFEPGQSKAFNRGKRDALLDHNKAIAEIFEKSYPESEFAQLFKNTNKQWTEIMDVEAINNAVDSIFEGGLNHAKAKKILENKNHQRIFKRALGEEGAKHFNQLLTDLTTSEIPFKMLKIAKEKGLTDFVKSASVYAFSPKLGLAKTSLSLAKKGFKTAINSMLDKPQLAFTWEKGIKNLKKGDFKAAQRDFNVLDAEVKALGK